MAAACDSEPIPKVRPVELEGVSLTRGDRVDAVLEGVDFSLARGECVLLTGATGSGKSTLLCAIAGLAGIECRTGTLRRSGRAPLLLQHVETQLLCPTVAEEIEFGLRVLGFAPEALRERTRDALARVGLAGFEARETDRLSEGEKQRVVLAALLALEPEILLLDEPLAALDSAARRALADAIAALKQRGCALLIAEHAPHDLLSIVDRVVQIENGRLHEAPLPKRSLSEADPLDSNPSKNGGPPLSLATLEAGDRVLVCGPNGSGKSTLLQRLAREDPRGRSVALVIQEPRRSLFARTVEAELAFGLERRGVARQQSEARIASLLARFDLTGVAARSPRRLSFGQQHRLAIAAALAARPDFVLLDEPFAGLDTASRARLLAALEAEQAESRFALVVASHDRSPLEDWCHRVHGVEAAGPAMQNRFALRPRPLQYRSGHSLLHHTGLVAKLLGATAIGALALWLDSLPSLFALLGFVLAGYALARVPIRDAWRDLRWLVLQAAILVAITLGLRGPGAFEDATRTALQLSLFFVPIALVVRTTGMASVLDAVRGRLPERAAFAAGATLRFTPFFARELGELVEMQRLRGALLSVRQLARPSAWRDWLACVALPMTVRAIEIAEEAADAAAIRGLGEARNDPGKERK